MRSIGLKAIKLVILFTLLLGLTPSLVADIEVASQIHLSWQSDDVSHTMVVSWRTNRIVNGVVYYDTEPGDGSPESYRYSAEANSHTHENVDGIFHDAELVNLLPDTRYFYICNSEGVFSDEKSFKTLPLTRDTIRIITGGDSRSNPELRDLVSVKMAEHSPDLILFSGDFVNDGRSDAQWDSFFDHVDTFWVTPSGDGIPIISAIGNHDGGSNYGERLALPGNEEWYSFNLGTDIHVTILNSESSVEGFAEQTVWLQEDLEKHRDYPWKLVLLHRNILKNYHDVWLTGVNRWVPLFDRYDVDIVLSGHSHNYQRSEPVNWTLTRTEAQDSYDEGIMYLTSGAWGAPLYETVEGWWVASTTSKLHFTVMDFHPNGTLSLRAIDETGEVFDSISLHKELPSEAALLAERLIESHEVAETLSNSNLAFEEEKDALMGSISDLIDDHSEDLQAQDEMVSELEEIISDLNTEVESRETDIENLQSTVTSLEAQLDAEPEPPLWNPTFLIVAGFALGGIAVFMILRKTS